MDATQKMLQTIINGQSTIKSELLGEIKKVNNKIDRLETEMKKGFKDVGEKLIKLTKRVDNIGLQLARLEDDTPTIEEFDALERRVSELEEKSAKFSPVI